MATTCKLIAKQVLSSAAASVLFNNIPQSGYSDLLLEASVRGNNTGATFDAVYIRFNTSTVSYSDSELSGRQLQGTGSSATSVSATGVIAAITTGPNATANTFGHVSAYIPNAFGSTNKSISLTSLSENNAAEAYIRATAGLWANTAAISSILCFPANVAGNQFQTNSSFFLYGITKS